jgi:uncharacterized protein
MTVSILSRLARELSLAENQVESTVALLDAGNTVPFITRYRKEATGGLDETQIRALAERLEYLRGLEARRAEVRAALEQGGHLTPELAAALAKAETLQTIEDLYLPFRPKRRTRAQVAREQGLEPLADLLLDPKTARRSRDEVAAAFLNEQVADVEAALAGARDIIAERVAEHASTRQAIREETRRTAKLRVGRKEGAADEKGVFQAYYDFEQQFRMLPPYRVLAINRGESEGVLKVDLGVDSVPLVNWMQRRHVQGSGWPADESRDAVEDGYKRLLAPAIERDLRSDLTAQAEQHALTVFAANLRGLLLQSPLRGKTVLGVDPGYRTGCKLAVVDATGKYLAGSLIYLHQGDKARAELTSLCQRHRVDVIAIGNGTASRETEQLVAAVIAAWQGPDAPLYTIVSEAGASVYSTSELAGAEFPALDATERGNISIARRLQDPLAELVKIDPRALGVGLYQHDVDQKQLAARLHNVVESVVNYVGVDLNTASPALLTYVAGLNSKVAQAIVARRDAEGVFSARQELKQIKGLGPKAFEQAAGFLRIVEAADPLDSTAIHPESYAAARKLIARFGGKHSALPEVAAQVRSAIKQQQTSLQALASELAVGEPTLADILDAMEKPGRDPRDSLPPPMLRADVLKMEDLQAGMWLRGTVRNVVDFGAFVDIGVKQDGLVHVSEMSAQRVRSPLDVVQVGDQIDVRVVSVDLQRQRIALSMREA